MSRKKVPHNPADPHPRSEPVRPDLAQRLVAGQRLTEIAEAYGVDRHTVRVWSQLDTVQAEVAELREAAREANHRALSALSDVAITTVGSVMASAVLLTCAHPACGGVVRCDRCEREQPGALPKDRLKAAEMVLDRTGYPKREVVEHAGEVTLSAPTSEQEAGILDEAAHILEERGHRELAAAVRAAGVA